MAGSYTVAYWLANKSSLDAGASFKIADTAAALQGALDQLTQDVHISAITVNDGPAAEVTVSTSQISTDAAALALLRNPNGARANVIVSDTAANIAARFLTVASNAYVNKIVVSNNAAVTLTAAQVGTKTATVGLLVNANASAAAVIVKDTNANISTYLNQIAAAGATVSSVVVSNNTQVSLTGAQVASDGAALAKVKYNNGATTGLFKVVDTAPNISAYLSSIAANANITAVTVSDNAAVSLTVGALSAYAGTLAKLGNADSSAYTLSVADSAANLSGGFDTLNGNAHVTGIVVADAAALNLTVAQIGADAHALSLTTNLGGGAYTLTVSDNGTALSAAIASLNANSHVTKIVVTSGQVALSGVSALTTYAHALGLLKQSDGVTAAQVSVAASAAHISSALDALAANPQVGKLIVCDSAANQVVVSVAQLASDAAALSALYAADGATPAQVTVSDSAAALSGGALGALQADAQVDSIVVASGSVTLNVTQYLADATALAELVDAQGHPAQVVVADAASAIGAHLSAFNAASQVSRLIVTSGEISMDAATAVSGIVAAAKLYTPGGKPAPIAVHDTAANISAAFDGLNAASRVDTIVVSDGQPLTLTAAQLAGDATALSELSGPYSIAVVDTAAAVQANLAVLQTMAGQIASITLTDAGTPTLTLAYGQLSAESAALALIASDFYVDVAGVSAAQAAGVGALVAGLDGSHASLVAMTVSDTAAAVQAHLDALQGVAGRIASIALTDAQTPTLTLASGRFYADAAALNKIAGAFKVALTGVHVADAPSLATNVPLVAGASASLATMAISDSASAVQNDLDALQGVANQISSITLTDGGAPILTLSYAQLSADASALGLIASDFQIAVTGVLAANAAGVGALVAGLDGTHASLASMSVLDSAASVQAHLDALQGVAGKIAAIALTDGATPTLTLAYGQLASDAAALSLIGGAYQLAVTGVAAGQVAGLSAHVAALDGPNATVASLAVSDTAAAVQANLGALQSAAGQISAIALTDATTPTLTLTYNQVLSDGVALSLINSSYKVAVTGVAVAAAAGIRATLTSFDGPHAALASIAIADSALNVRNGLDGLQAIAGDIAAIALTDVGAPTLTLAYGQLASDATALGLIASDYRLDVTGVAAANASGLPALVAGLDGAHASLDRMSVVDSAAAVQAHLDALQAVSGLITTIALTDSPGPTLTFSYDKLQADSAVLRLIDANYFVALTGVSASEAATASGVVSLQAGAHAALISMAVTDAAAAVQTSLDSLESVAPTISSITLTDATTPTLTLAYGQLSADADALARIAGDFKVAVTGVAAGAAAGVAGLVAGLDGAHASLASMAISDTGQNVQNALDTLQSLAGQISSIALTDATAPTLQLAFGALTSDAGALGLIHSDYKVALVDVRASQAASAPALVAGLDGAHASLAAMAVSDTAAAVQANLGALQSVSGFIASIALTDLSTPTLTLGYQTMLSDSGALQLISQDYLVALTGVAASQAATAGVYVAALGGVHAALASMVVTDTAAAVQTSLDSLESVAGQISSITLTDATTPTLTLAYGQLSADAGALARIAGDFKVAVTGVAAGAAAGVAGLVAGLDGAHASLASMTISDTGQNVRNSLDTLQSLGGQISSIALTDATAPTLSLAFDTLTSDSGVLGLIHSDYKVALVNVRASQAAAAPGFVAGLDGAHATLAAMAVSDTAAAVQANLGALQIVAGQIVAITLTDSSTPTLTLTYGQLSADASVLGLIQTPYRVNVTGVSAANAAGVAAQVAGLDGAYASLGAISVTDSAAAVQARLDALQGIVGQIASITLTDAVTPTLTVAYGQLSSDSGALGLIASPFRFAVTGVAVADAVALAAFIDDQYGEHATLASMTIADSAAAVQGGLDDLRVVAAKIASITLTDAGTPTLTLAYGQLSADAAVLARIAGDYQIDVTGVAAADAAGLPALVAGLDVAHASLAAMSVSDTAANVQANLDALQGVGAKLGGGVTLTDATIPTLTLAYGQLTADAVALGQIRNAFVVNVTGVSAAQAAGVSGLVGALDGANATLGAISVSDTAADVQANLDQLQGVVSEIAAITLTDATAPTLTLAYGTLLSDATALGQIVSDYRVAVTGVSIAERDDVVTTVVGLDGSHASLASISISDIASTVQANLDALQAMAGGISAIVLIDNGALTLSLDQALNDSDAIARLQNVGGGQVNLTVAGTAADVAAHIDALNAAANISSVVISDNGVLQLNAARAAEAGAIAKLTDADPSVGVSIVVTDTAANVSANLAALSANDDLTSIVVSDNQAITLSVNGIGQYNNALQLLQDQNGGPVSLIVVDSAADIAAAASDLSADDVISQVLINDNNPLSLTVSQYEDDSLLFGKLGTTGNGPYALSIADTAADLSGALDSLADAHIASIRVLGGDALTVSVGQLSNDAATLAKTLNGDGSAYTLSVTDSATAIAGAFDALNANAHVSAIDVLPGGAVTLGAASAANDTTAEALLRGSNGVTLAQVAVRDTAANIAAQLDALSSNAAVAAVTISDSPPALTLTAAQATNDAAGLAKITNAGYTIAVVDTAAHIKPVIAALGGLAQVNKIVVSDSSAGGFTLGAAAAVGAANALGELYQANGTTAQTVTVSDSAANVVANLAALDNLATVTALTVASGSGTLSSPLGVAAAAFNETGAGTQLGVNVALSYAGTLTQAAGAILSLGANGALTLTRGAKFSGAVQGAGQLQIAGGTTTFNAGATVSVANLSATGQGSTLAVSGLLTYGQTFSASAQSVISVATGALLDLTGSANLNTVTVTGSGTVQIDGTATVSGLTLNAGATFADAGAVTQSGSALISGTSPTLSVAAAGSWSIAGDYAIARGASNAALTVAGLLAKTSGTGNSALSVSTTVTGALSAATGTLSLTGAVNSLSGALTGAGKIVLGAGATTLSAGATASVASLTESGAGTQLNVNEAFAYAGAFAQGQGAVATVTLGNSLTLTGATSLSGAVGGAGTLSLAGGVTSLAASTALSVANWSVSGASTNVNFSAGLTYAGAFSASAGAKLTIASGMTLELAGAATLNTASTSGAGVLKVDGATSVNALTLGTGLTVAGAVTQSGAVSAAASIGVASGATWSIAGNYAISRGAAGISLSNSGVLAKTGGSGASAIGLAVVNSGTLQASSGTLDLTQAVTGTGTDVIGAGSTLEFDASVAATQSVSFAGSGATLSLFAPTSFAASIAGFDLGGSSNDAIAFNGAWSLLTTNEGAASTTLTLGSGSSRATLTLTGDYRGDTFHALTQNGATRLTSP